MKLRFKLLAFCCSCLLLSGCIFPLQKVSPDPLPATTPFVFSTSPNDAVIPLPASAPLAESFPEPLKESTPSFSGRRTISDPKLALFWYAMADAGVYDLRQAFSPVLEASGIRYREFDAENDPYRQVDQIRDAVSGGWNILAVQMVSDNDPEIIEELLRAADGYPVIFFDRVPDPDTLPSRFLDSQSSVGLICMNPEERGRIQGSMIGNYLVSHFSSVDLNQDGQISYTFLLSNADNATAQLQNHGAIEAANKIMIENGYRPLVYYDEETTICYQADPSGAGSSDAGTDIIRNNLSFYNYSNSNTIELIAADSDDMALGALTALQVAWCNLGDGSTITIPLFGSGGSVAARSAVSLGQMAGTVGTDTDGYAHVLVDTIQNLSDGKTVAEALSNISMQRTICTGDEFFPFVLYLSPNPIMFDGLT